MIVTMRRQASGSSGGDKRTDFFASICDTFAVDTPIEVERNITGFTSSTNNLSKYST
jgi:hypothetical protein